MKKISKSLIILIEILIITLSIYGIYFFSKQIINSSNLKSQNNVCVPYRHNFWTYSFAKYFKGNDMEQKVLNLKDGLDEKSVQYIDKYMENSKYWFSCTNYSKGYSENNLWTDYDKELFKTFQSEIAPPLYMQMNFNPYIWKSVYGMRDLPKTVLDKINGKDIIDIGAWPGDTIYTFHKNFPNSTIYAYEPVEHLMNSTRTLLGEMKLLDTGFDLVNLIQKGVSDRQGTENITYSNLTTKSQIVTLDEEYKSLNRDNLGLIKMDTEGYESSIIDGSKEIIKKYKPVLVISIYHRPEDFFEMKDKIKSINPNYKFVIRRSENIIADADLVLIAY